MRIVRIDHIALAVPQMDEGLKAWMEVLGLSLGARELVPTIPPALDDFVMRAIATDPEDRFPTAADAARSLELALAPAKTEEVGRWVSTIARASRN